MSNAIVNGMAGAGGGIIAQIITYPLQTVNTRQQTERVSKKGSVPSPAARNAGNTLIQIFQVIKSEGLGGLYSGLKPSLIGTAASQGIYYSFYQSFKNKAEAIAAANKRKGLGDGSPGMLSWLIVAALAGSLNVLLTNPIWVLVTRMQTHTQAERKIMEAKKEALLKEASENVLVHSSLQEQLDALDWIKPRPYGTFQAVNSTKDIDTIFYNEFLQDSISRTFHAENSVMIEFLPKILQQICILCDRFSSLLSGCNFDLDRIYLSSIKSLRVCMENEVPNLLCCSEKMHSLIMIHGIP